MMKLQLPSLVACLCLASLLPAPAAEEFAFFESKIRPVLVKHCYECHSTESGKAKGGLLVDTKQGLQTGGDTGPAVVPMEVSKSLLLMAIKHADPDLEMPPKSPPLPKAVIADFETWIKAGAPDPRETSMQVAERPPVDVKSGREFWSYRKPQPQPAPEVKDKAWAKRPLDRFILAQLEKNDLAPSPDAKPGVLLRRLHFDLTGLPPTPKEMTTFAQGWRDEAGREALLEKTVDALLKSPRFGERWGRHWLDVARFAESNGRESNLTFPHAWRYRDYVIDALNADKPYDRFITEQIAGDLLPAKDDAERAQLHIATTFLAMGAKGLNEMNSLQFAADLVDEQLDTVTRAITATSVACARCHDHKSEPFSMEDYYALAGIFKSTKTHYGNWIDSENNNPSDLIRLPDLPGQLIQNKSITAAKVKELKASRAKLDAEEKAQNEFIAKAREEGRDIGDEGFKLLATAIRIYWSRGGIDGQLMTVDDQGRALPLSMGVSEAPKVQEAMLLNRGEITQPVKAVKRGFPEVLKIQGVEPAAKQSGRLELAQWLTHPENPLTSRVIANRIWKHLFGVGLVRTTDNLGYSGERPTHPELLDYLALEMTRRDWSVKALIREVALSRSYRQSSGYREACFEKDPDNRLLWRANKRRLDAEVIRDSMLAVSGELDVTRRPGSLVSEISSQSVSLIGFNKALPADLDGSLRRSVYLPVLRDHLPDVLELFDFAEPSLVTGHRDVTNVPMQALYLMNGPWVQARAAALAARVSKEKATRPEQLRRAFTLCFNRPPDQAETELAETFFQKTQSSIEGAPAEDETMMLALYCQALLASAEFRYVD
ncbi:PSD1 and planctomycete cytochrome C domain-containing protein [Prosthecobacter sp. SYSU 5D2]|uniref:PSD1 and planctomycete cytochrome C domain-containing protein n=1 Tax=Prosthecobacter sp. SYSU 5D2 TaxID=3134134 RepID=UPI0031FE7715